MSVNKFGQYSDELYSTTRSQKQIPNSAILRRTRDGHTDLNGGRIVNVANPENENDVCNKKYVDSAAIKLKNDLENMFNVAMRNVIPEIITNQSEKMGEELKQTLLEDLKKTINKTIRKKLSEIEIEGSITDPKVIRGVQ